MTGDRSRWLRGVQPAPPGAPRLVCRVFPGDHFYLVEQADAVRRVLEEAF